MIRKFNDFVNEGRFAEPKRSFTDRLPGGEERYEERVAAARKQYFEGPQREKFMKQLRSAKGMEDLLELSKEMADYGYMFPVAGMVTRDNLLPNQVRLDDIFWMSADRESEYSAKDLAEIESNKGKRFHDTVLTYELSWQFWCANIVRCLMFWQAPYGKEADAQIRQHLDELPACPISERDTIG